jgi:predicted metal-dependent hydrolase
MVATQSTRHPIVARKLRFDFTTVPKHWFGGHRLATHIANGVNMLFPAGERGFVRAVNAYLDHPAVQADPELVAQVRGFFGQEGKHARAHEDYNDMLRAHGFDIDGFLSRHERFLYGWLEPRLPAILKLSATAAAEHFTAIMANNAFEDAFLEAAHPMMRQLLLWHAAEEIEHKAVAFDVLQKVNPSYAVRVAGLCFATITLGVSWAIGTATLLKQEKVTRAELRAEAAELRNVRAKEEGGIARRVFLRGIAAYLKRDFHPSQIDNYKLAAEYFAKSGIDTMETSWSSTASSPS